DRTPGVQKQTYHQLLLAKTQQGYKNLMQLTTLAHLQGFYYRPRITWDLLAKYKEGLVATSSCLQGIIPQLILQGQIQEALNQTKKFFELFGKDFYLELQKHIHLKELDLVNKTLIDFSRRLGIPVVATNDLHYVNPEDARAQDALLAIQTKTTLSDKNRLTMIGSPDFYLKSAEEMAHLFPDYPEALKNSLKIADACQVDISTGKWILPDFPLPKNYQSSEKYLRDLAEAGMKQRFKPITHEQKQRFDYELKVICDKGFATYFLIVQDFVNWAKKHHIRVGPGRGSVAGSLVAYALRITSIDPLFHNIPFERFLNPQRPSPPDIDLDFADDRRDEVIEYVASKYGKDKVAQIITFGTMEARGAIRDVGRVLGMPYSDPDKIAKLIPFGHSLEEAMVNVIDLQEYYRQDKFKELIDLAKKIEGTARHASTHAAGVVIGDKPLIEYTPLQLESKNERIMTQYDMYSLDCNIDQNAIGLLKMDFLGLSNLTILQNAVNLVKDQTGKTLDISELPLDDAKTYQLLSAGHTIGVFQLESPGMRSVARKLQPSRFSDITAMVSLYRPGPMALIDTFIAGKKNPAKIEYPHPDLKPVLAETYGVAVYQEQALEIANVMAGYTLGEADILRRAIGKKKRSIMTKEKSKFIKGSEKKGYSRKIAEKIWGYIDKFAGYGFNKAHATAYAMIAYQTAYLKANFPVEFMTALLTAEVNNKDKVPMAVDEAKTMGIVVLPPDINMSLTGFSIEADKGSLNHKAIRFGMSAIKNVGEAAITTILAARKKHRFKSLTDFCERIDQQKVNKKVLESLIQVGTFDAFGKRSSLMLGLETIRQKAGANQREANSNQVSMFAGASAPQAPVRDQLPESEEFSKIDLLSFEKQLLGFYLTDHPHGEALKKIKTLVSHHIADIDPQIHLNQSVTLGGTIRTVKPILTRKNNHEMAFATLDDDSGQIELVIFPTLYSQTKSLWQSDQVVLVTGKVDMKNRLTLIVESALKPEDTPVAAEAQTAKPGQSEKISLRLTKTTPKAVLIKINQLFQANPGPQRVFLELENGRQPKVIRLPFTVEFDSVKNQVEALLKPVDGRIVID
ncbi:MAG: DNA polymerase III subunit alpha, partial [Patescibacteria group bacterium]|nr:DNA polymerase III subunit alpha [Patescibacteria group bacterium]